MQTPRIRMGRIVLAVGFVAAAAVPIARSFLPPLPRSNTVSMPEAFAREARDPRWAGAMEARLRDAMTPQLARLDGAQLVDIECRARSCRFSLAVTSALKQRLNRESVDQLGFALDNIRKQIGSLARRVDALYDDFESSRFERALRFCSLRGAEQAALRWRLHHLQRENYVVAFDEDNRDPADHIRWNTKILQAWHERSLVRRPVRTEKL